MITAYKAFDRDLKCRGFQFEIGKIYKHEGKISLCSSGFHACEKLSDCFNYYSFSENTRIAKVNISGKIIKDDSKLVTDEIEIVKELAWKEILKLANSGDQNSGDQNSGVFNTNEPRKVRVFNKYITREEYNSIKFPSFLYFDLTVWIYHDTATPEEKEKFKKQIETCGGFLKTLTYKEAFKLSWNKADKTERMLIKKIPGFDKELFFEISGINIDEEN